ncbi:MAG TPA: ABC transporter permease, partial [Candidatus Dormibacteraeota bacterium]
MSAVLRTSLGDLRRRKVQTFVLAFVLFLASLSTTLSLTLLVETDAPFDHAFAQSQGAHLTMTFAAASVSESQLRATASTSGITVAGGPWRVDPWTTVDLFGRSTAFPLEGRADPGGPVDRLTLTAGRWALGPAEVVLAQSTADILRRQVGDTISPAPGSPIPALTVVGIAAAVGDNAAAWTVPAGVPLISAGTLPTSYVMTYRLVQANTSQEINTVASAISASVGAGAVIDTANYLDAKLNADRATAVMIPFLLAFSAFALLASAFVIGNLVTGAVIAGTREIGIMKSIGFTPAQVIAVLGGQMLVPALLGALLGLPVGILLSQPFLSNTAEAFRLPRTFGVAPGPDALGLIVILMVVIAATILASLRAGRMSAAAAIATGSSPASSAPAKFGNFLPRLWARLGLGGRRLPSSLALGFGESLTRPARSAMTVGAILIGVATVTFALGLTRSLTLVEAGATRTQAVQLELLLGGRDKSAGSPRLSDAQLSSLIAAQPETSRFVGEREVNVTVGGAGRPVPITAYNGDASWLGYQVIQGRWFDVAGEAVAPTAFFTRTGHHLGETIVANMEGHDLRLTLVGEIFDIQGDGVSVRTDWATIPTAAQAQKYEIQVRPGTDLRRYVAALQSSAPGLGIGLLGDSGINTAFLLIESTLGGLALILALIAIAGVFNTVVLNTREKARDIAILKAIGMTPHQVTTMVLASVLVFGIVGAVVGIPAGIALHGNILTMMGQIASSTRVPTSFYRVFDLPLLGVLAVAGIAIAMLGALLPA